MDSSVLLFIAVLAGLGLFAVGVILWLIYAVVRVIRSAWNGPVTAGGQDTPRSSLESAHDGLVDRVERLLAHDVPRLQSAHDALVARVEALAGHLEHTDRLRAIDAQRLNLVREGLNRAERVSEQETDAAKGDVAEVTGELEKHLESLQSESSRLALRFAAAYPPIHNIYEFELTFDTTKLADTLDLTPEERAALEATPTRPEGFVLEQWNDFNRWRVRQAEQDREREWFLDDHGDRAWGITLWRAELGNRSDLLLRWEHPHDLTLYAYGGRFGGFPVPDGLAPEPKHVLFLLAIPFPFRFRNRAFERLAKEDQPDAQGLHKDGREVTYRAYDDVATYLVPSDEDPAPFVGYVRMPGRDTYRCDRRERGFCWTLTRWDLRPRLTALVDRQDSKMNLLTLGTLGPDTFKLDPAMGDQKVSAHLWTVEPDDAGRARPHVGEVVWVTLDEHLEVDRIWPIVNCYLPPECPQCRRPQYPGFHRNQDGVCYDCRPRRAPGQRESLEKR